MLLDLKTCLSLQCAKRHEYCCQPGPCVCVILVSRHSHEDCCSYFPVVFNFSELTKPWRLLVLLSCCSRFHWTHRATRTAINVVFVFLTSVLYRQSHGDWCHYCPGVCDFSIQTEPWGLLSVLSWGHRYEQWIKLKPDRPLSQFDKRRISSALGSHPRLVNLVLNS